ncbi:hypothetical protein [Thermaurantiacus sp.]
MIALVLASAVALAELPPQPFPPGMGCAIFLWTRTEPPKRIAMLAERPAVLRVMPGRAPVDLPRGAEPGSYTNGKLKVTLDIAILPEAGFGGSDVVGGAMRVETADGEEQILAVGGLRACN